MGCRLKENPESLFVAFFEVAAPVDKSSAPQILSQFPADFADADVTKELPKFCFPCDLSKCNIAGQFFTFVLTGLDHKQRFGFCRHPPGAANCLCILSYLPWFDIFYKILNQLAELKNHQKNDIAQQLIAQLFTAEVPSAYQQVRIAVDSDDGTAPVVNFTGPDSKSLPALPADKNISEYFSVVSDANMMILFASLLFERRILITSDKLSRLTACVHSAASLLYPLYWQHIYIPVMPAHLIDYCCAPMPFLVGIHSSFMPQVRKMALDEVVILNADNNSIETPFEDLQMLPPEAVSQLKKNLKNSSLFYKDTLARSFLKVLVYLLGGYREAVRIKTNNELWFDSDIFVQCRSTHMQPFLEKLMHLQHFTQFIDARVQMISAGKPINDLFEEELKIAKQDGSLSSKNLKETFKSHLTNVKTDSKKILKDVQKNVQQKMIQAQGSIRPKANPEAMKLKLRQGRDFANKQFIGMKTKLIKGKETEDLDVHRRTNHRQTAYLDISLPLPAFSAPNSPSASPDSSPLPTRSNLDVRRKTTSNASRKISEENTRPVTVAGIEASSLPITLRSNSDVTPPRLPQKSKSSLFTNQEEPSSSSSNMNLMDDLQEVLQKIESDHLGSAEGKTVATDDLPVPMPRRRRVQRESGDVTRSIQRPLIPPPPIPPRRERRSPLSLSNERLIDIATEERRQPDMDLSQAQGAAVQNALGVDCEDHILAFQSVHLNNNALASAAYPREDMPRNSSAQTLLADYGLQFGMPPTSPPAAATATATASTADGASPTHHLSVPGLRATSSSPDLHSFNPSSSPPRPTLVQQVLVQQPPASTLPDLLNPTNTTPRQSGGLGMPPSGIQPMMPPAGAKVPMQSPFQLQHTPLQPVAASGNPFQPASKANENDPFADLVSFQRQEVTSPSWKK